VDGLVNQLLYQLTSQISDMQIQVYCAEILNHLCVQPDNAIRLYDETNIMNIILKFLEIERPQ